MTAMLAARNIVGLSSYSFKPVPDPITGGTVLRVGRFGAARDAQLARAALGAGNPDLRILVAPYVEDLDLADAGSQTPRVSTPSPIPTRRPTPSPTPTPTRVARVTPTPSPTPSVPSPRDESRHPDPTTIPTMPTSRPGADFLPAADALSRVPPHLRPRDEGEPAPQPDRDLGERPPAGWSVQIGSFSRPANAINLRRRVLEEGYDAYVIQAESRGTTWYRVQVGTYRSASEASHMSPEIEDRIGEPTLVVRRD